MDTVIGIIIVLATVLLMIWPALRKPLLSRPRTQIDNGELYDLVIQKDLAFEAINELQRDYEMGNLSESDHEELRSKYEERSILIMKQIDDWNRDHTMSIQSEIRDDLPSKN